MKNKLNKTACITGATSGIGAAFAKEFASQGYDLIITGRRQEKINRVAEQLRRVYHIQVEVIIADFSTEKVIDLLGDKISRIDNLEVLVNNAGYGSEGSFCDERANEQIAKLHVSGSAAVKLCHAVLPNMISRGNGIIINVSSLSACFPAPGAAMYSATRAFLVTFTESIYLELKGTGVKVQVLCPGTVKTDFHEKIGFDPENYYQDKGLLKILTTKQVIEASLKNLEKDKVVCIPGLFNYFSWIIFKIIPRKLTYKIVQFLVKKREEFKRIELASNSTLNYIQAS